MITKKTFPHLNDLQRRKTLLSNLTPTAVVVVVGGVGTVCEG